MVNIKMYDLTLHTEKPLPEIGCQAPDFHLAATSLETVTLENFANKAVLLNVYPCLDTTVCFSSAKYFAQKVGSQDDLVVACVSMDLPFTLARIQKGEPLNSIVFLSDFRNRSFGDDYGLTIIDGPLAALLARAVIILDDTHRIIYHELVADINMPPNYDKAIATWKKISGG